jgi:hypothetical protein
VPQCPIAGDATALHPTLPADVTVDASTELVWVATGLIHAESQVRATVSVAIHHEVMLPGEAELGQPKYFGYTARQD